MDMREYARLVMFVTVIAVLLAIGFANLFSDLPFQQKPNVLFIRKVDSYAMKAEALNTTQKFKMGVNINPDMLDFGRVTLGGQVRKRMVLLNPSPYPSKAKFFAFGNISKHIHVGYWDGKWNEQWSVIIPPNSSRSVEIGFKAEKQGNFTGVLKIVTFMPRANLGPLMQWI